MRAGPVRRQTLPTDAAQDQAIRAILDGVERRKQPPSVRVRGVTLLGFMFLIMFGLKLAGVFTASWWIVTAPLWGPLALVILLALAGEGIIALDRVLTRRKAKRAAAAAVAR